MRRCWTTPWSRGVTSASTSRRQPVNDSRSITTPRWRQWSPSTPEMLWSSTASSTSTPDRVSGCIAPMPQPRVDVRTRAGSCLGRRTTNDKTVEIGAAGGCGPLRLPGHQECRRLGHGPDHYLVDVDMRRPRYRIDDAIRDVLGHQRLHALVDGLCRFPIAAETYDAELSLDHARCDLGHPDGLSVQLESQGPRYRTHCMLGGGVTRPTLVRLEARNRPQVDDVPVLRFAEQRNARASDSHQTEHIGLPHPDPVLVTSFLDCGEPKRETRVVDQHVDTAERFGYLGDESIDARLVGHVERQGHAQIADHALDASQPACAGNDLVTLPPQSHHSGGADAGGSSRDDSNRPRPSGDHGSPP